MIGTAAEPVFEITVDLQRKTDSFGVNSIVFPFSPPYYTSDGKEIKTMGDLINEINRLKPGAISTFGHWDKENQRPTGFLFDKEGKLKSKESIEKNPGEVDLQPVVSYQIYVKENVPAFTLRARPKSESAMGGNYIIWNTTMETYAPTTTTTIPITPPPSTNTETIQP